MNLRLHHFVFDITGSTGMRITKALFDRERDPEVLATCRDVGSHSLIETIRAARGGNGLVSGSVTTRDQKRRRRDGPW